MPAAHLMHAPCAVSFCTVPGLHCVCVGAPVLQKWPASHAMQSVDAVITVRAEF